MSRWCENHLIVVPDADLELTAQNVMASFTGCAGQRCMAASVLVAVGDISHIIDEIHKQASAVRLGDDLGAITNASSVDRITGYIDRAEASGSSILVDGRGKKGNDTGYWVGPTVIDNVPKGAPAACDEIFGPVISMSRRHHEEASNSRTLLHMEMHLLYTPPMVRLPIAS